MSTLTQLVCVTDVKYLSYLQGPAKRLSDTSLDRWDLQTEHGITIEVALHPTITQHPVICIYMVNALTEWNVEQYK